MQYIVLYFFAPTPRFFSFAMGKWVCSNELGELKTRVTFSLPVFFNHSISSLNSLLSLLPLSSFPFQHSRVLKKIPTNKRWAEKREVASLPLCISLTQKVILSFYAFKFIFCKLYNTFTFVREYRDFKKQVFLCMDK